VDKVFNVSLTMQAQESGTGERGKGIRSLDKGIGVMVECLLIDKDPTERKRVSQLLGDLGLNFTESSAAIDGLKYCNDNFPELVVMAASTEGMAPSDFIRQVRRTPRGKKTVVILYADEPDADEIGQSILEGAADFIMQPFDRELLQFKLHQAGVI
jgi:two-component system, chemotaxis family, chemotaxis protein CheY